MTGIQKYFPGVHALDGVDLELRAGEVMALVGENGAGKSTLMKILTGIYAKDGGKIELFGKEVEIHSLTKRSSSAFVSFIRSLISCAT